MKTTPIHYKSFTLLFLLLIISFQTSNAQQTMKENANTLKSPGYAPVNGLKLYYEIHGEGTPIVLLHGSYMNIPLNYAELIPHLAKNHQVIALEMQGHGRTADTDRPYSFEAMASDVAGLLHHLKIKKADILGYSFGATVGLEVAIKYPEVVNKLVFISSVYKLDGWIPQARDLFRTIVPEFFENTPLKTEYDRLAPDPAHWQAFVKKLAKFDAQPFDLGKDKVKALKCPVLFINGDNDGVDLHHVAELYQLVGGGVFGEVEALPKSQLVILPGQSHVSLMMETNQLMAVIQPFLDQAN